MCIHNDIYQHIYQIDYNSFEVYLFKFYNTVNNFLINDDDLERKIKKIQMLNIPKII